MPVTATQLIDALANLDPAKPGDRGQLRWMRSEFARDPSRNRTQLTALDRVLADRIPDPSGVYLAPWQREGVRLRLPDRPSPLSAADVAFLQLVGARDPKEVTDEQVVRLAELAAHCTPARHPSPSDAALVNAVAGPVIAHHEALAQRSELVALAGGSGPVLRLPAPKLDGDETVLELASLIEAEIEGLTTAEARGRAKTAMSTALGRTFELHHQQQLKARAKLTELEGAA